MPARRGEIVALAAARIGFRGTDPEELALVVQNDALCAAEVSYIVVPLQRCPLAAEDFPVWVPLEREQGLVGRWVAITDEIRRVAAGRIAPGVRGRLSRGNMRRIDAALRWVLAL